MFPDPTKPSNWRAVFFSGVVLYSAALVVFILFARFEPEPFNSAGGGRFERLPTSDNDDVIEVEERVEDEEEIRAKRNTWLRKLVVVF